MYICIFNKNNRFFINMFFYYFDFFFDFVFLLILKKECKCFRKRNVGM